MLERSADAVFLDAVDHCRSHFSRQQRVLGIVLEIPSAKRVPVDIRTRSEKNVHAILKHLIAHISSGLLYEFEIPGGRKHCGNRITGAIERPGIAFSFWCNAKAGRTISKDYCRNAESGNAVDHSCRSRNTGVGKADSIETGSSSADYKGALLFRCHGCHDLRNIVLTKLRGLIGQC